MALDLTVQGDADGIRSVGDWLNDRAAAAAIELDLEAAYLAGDATALWSGMSGYAYNSTLQAARRATDCAIRFLQDLAEVMHAYAARLERGERFFDELLAYARNKGLTVYGRVVQTPSTYLNYCPVPGDDTADQREYNNYLSRLSTYHRIGTDAGTWEGQLDAWIFENFGGLGGYLDSLEDASGVLSALMQGNEILIATAFEAAANRKARDLIEWRTTSATFAEKYQTYLKDKRSGDPRRKAAAAKAVPEDIRKAMHAADDMVEYLSSAKRIISGLGIVGDVTVGALDLATGGSPSSVIVNTGAGVAGAWAAGTAVALVTGPGGWVVGAAVVGGIAVGEGAQWVWETAVSLEHREGIDDFFVSAADAVIFWDDAPRIPR